MPDVTFDWKWAKGSSSGYAQKRAVLWPLTRRRSLASKAVVKDLKWLMWFWRERIIVLKEAGWQPLKTIGKAQFCRNCPPAIATAVATKSCRVCNLWHVCPWCYARRVDVVFDAIAKLLPARGALQKPLRFVEVRCLKKVPVRDAGKMIDSMYKDMHERAKWLMKKLKPLGAYYTVQLEPHLVHGHYSAWRISYRAVMLVPSDWEQPKWLTKSRGDIRKVRVTDVYRRKGLIGLVSRTCRYPVGLMRGDPQMTITSLNVRRGKRASAMLGCFRSSKSTVEL